MRTIACSVLVLGLAACAAPYGPAGGVRNFFVHGGYGYSDRQLDGRTWEVTYSGKLEDRQYVFNSAIRRSAEIASKAGFPYFTAADIRNDSLRYTNFSGSQYYGTSVFTTVKMQGYKSRDERCQGGKILKSNLDCDLYDTEATLDDHETDAQRATRRSERAKRLGNQGDERSDSPVWSPQGDRIAFVSASTNFGPTQGLRNVFVKDLRSGALTRVSVGLHGDAANGHSGRPRFSADGGRLLFDSEASNLVTGDTNGRWDVFIADLRSGALQRVSVIDEKEQNGGFDAQISKDGFHLAFVAEWPRPAPAQRELCTVVKDLRTGASTRLTYTAPDGGRSCSKSAATFLADGQRVVFVGNDSRGKQTLLVTNLQTLATTDLLGEGWRQLNRDTAPYAVGQLTVSGDGTRLAFSRWESDAQGNVRSSEVFVVTLSNGHTSLLLPARNGMSYRPAFFPDGNRVAFGSDRIDLVPGDTNRVSHIFVKDLRSGAIQCVSSAANGARGNAWSGEPQVSNDGTRVLFASESNNLVLGDTNDEVDVYVKTLATGAISRASVTTKGSPD